MKFDLIQIAGIIAIVLSCIIGLYFIQTRKTKKTDNILLSGILFVYALIIICSLILSSGINQNLFRPAHIANQSIFLIGPLLYFYIKSQFFSNFQITKKLIYHSIPFAAAGIYLIVKLYFMHFPITCRVNHILLGGIAFIHSFVYFYFSSLELKQNGFSMLKYVNNLKDSKLGWLPFLVYGCFSIWLTKLLFFIAWDVSGYYNGCNELINLYFLVSFILLNIFVYTLLVNPQYFNHIKKYKYSGLTHDEKLKYKNQLISLMENEKAYRNPLISLNLLAKQLGIPSRYLSQVINEIINKTFYDFINCYRIQECKDFLSDSNNSQKTILEITYEVGFNSKSTFNTSFIKYVGITPKEFRKKYRKTHHLN